MRGLPNLPQHGRASIAPSQGVGRARAGAQRGKSSAGPPPDSRPPPVRVGDGLVQGALAYIQMPYQTIDAQG